MLTELNGSSLNQVVKVKPVSCGHLVSGGTITADPALPGKLKKTSGPDLRQRYIIHYSPPPSLGVLAYRNHHTIVEVTDSILSKL